ncbi:hypothetical protein EIP86_002843 [Pleurotus ostreatoroseus]|nr:hypothetical protein EIP86_002843 [Pleurotus ostreatoroseus]
MAATPRLVIDPSLLTDEANASFDASRTLHPGFSAPQGPMFPENPFPTFQLANATQNGSASQLEGTHATPAFHSAWEAQLHAHQVQNQPVYAKPADLLPPGPGVMDRQPPATLATPPSASGAHTPLSTQGLSQLPPPDIPNSSSEAPAQSSGPTSASPGVGQDTPGTLSSSGAEPIEKSAAAAPNQVTPAIVPAASKVSPASAAPSKSKRSSKKNPPGRKSWVPSEKRAFLEKYEDQWTLARHNNNAGEFYSRITRLWMKKYPLDLPLEQDSSDPLPDPPEVGLEEVIGVGIVSDEEAEKRAKLYENLRTRLMQWYHNRYGGVRMSSQKAQVNTFLKAVKKSETAKQPRKPSELGMYTKMFWDDKIKTPIAEALKPIEAELEAKQARGEHVPKNAKRVARMKLQPSLIKQLYDLEDNETKMQVRTAVEEIHQENLANAVQGLGKPQTPEEYHQAIRELPAYVQALCDALCEKTGLTCAVMMAGPIPELGGILSVRSIHSGRTTGLNPLKWPELDPLGYAAAEDSMLKFAEQVYAPEEMFERALPHTLPGRLCQTPTPASSTGCSTDTAGDSITEGPEADRSTPTAPQNTLTGASAIPSTSSTPSTLSTVPTLPPLTVPSTDGVPLQASTYSNHPTTSNMDECTPAMTTPSSATLLSSQPAESTLPSDPARTVPPPPTEPVKPKPKPRQVFHPTQLVDTAAYSGPSLAHQPTIVPTPQRSSTPPQMTTWPSYPPPGLDNVRRTLVSNTQPSFSQDTSTPISSQPPTPPDVGDFPVQCRSAFEMVLKKFHWAKKYGRWAVCVEGMLKLEVASQYPETDERLPKKCQAHRPDEFKSWFRDGRPDVVPEDIDLTRFAEQCWNWWLDMQPKARGISHQERPSAISLAEWTATVRKPTKSGFYLVLIALTWWDTYVFEHESTDAIVQSWLRMVDDVAWAVESWTAAEQRDQEDDGSDDNVGEESTHPARKGPQKRGAPAGGSAPRKKRRR